MPLAIVNKEYKWNENQNFNNTIEKESSTGVKNYIDIYSQININKISEQFDTLQQLTNKQTKKLNITHLSHNQKLI